MTQPARRRPPRDDGLFKALADPSRRAILRLLSGGDLPLNKIEERFRMSRPAVIKHIRVLKECRLVRVRKSGRQTIHQLDARPLQRLRDWASHFDGFWDSSLERLKDQVESVL
jgi:DNA-binding transcriptional ArsR family regulator